MFVAYLYRFFIGFITVAFVSRYLGPKDFGVYSYSLSLFTFIELFMVLINHEVLKREFVKSENPKLIIKSVLTFQFLISILLFLLTQIALWYFEVESGERRDILFIFSFALFFRVIDVFSYYFSSQMRNDLIGISEVSVVTLFNSLRGFLVWFQFTLSYFAFAWVIQKIINFVVLGALYIKNHGLDLFKVSTDKKVVASLLKSSFPLFLAVASTLVFTRLDQVMLGNMLGEKSVGIYAIVVKLSEPWVFISVILTQSVYPDLIKAYAENINAFYTKVIKTSSLLLYSSLGIVLFMNLFSEVIVDYVFSTNYLDAIPIIKLHILSLIFIFWLNLTNQYEVIVGATRLTLLKTLLASLLNILLNLYLIPIYGIIGASVSTILSYAFSSFILNLFLSEIRTLFILQVKSIFFWKYRWINK